MANKIKRWPIAVILASLFSVQVMAQEAPSASDSQQSVDAQSPATEETPAPADAGTTAASEQTVASEQQAAEPTPASDTPQSAEVASTESAPAEAAPVEEKESFFQSLFSDFSMSANGFFRVEDANRTTHTTNRNNQAGNVLNDRTVARTAYCPPTLCTVGGVVPVGLKWGDLPLGVGTGSILSGVPGLGGLPNLNVGYTDNLRRGDYVNDSQNDFNYAVIRGESEVKMTFSSRLTFTGRIRALYAPGRIVGGFEPSSVANLQGGITGGLPDLYHKRPNLFGYEVEGNKHPNPLELSGSNYLVYLPALVFDYSAGPVNVRVGNQAIAWGQSIFFRVFDVPNGLDLRRHLILGRALEEFSDSREPNLGIRVSAQATDSLLVDAFVAKFQPSIFPNPNTAYNIIPAQFTVHDRYSQYGYDHKFNYGIRLKADYGDWGWQAMYTRRYNPDGTFRWTESGVNKPLQGGLGSLASLVNTAYAAKAPNCGAAYNPATCRLYGSIGEALSHTPFEASSAGVYSEQEWFNYAADVRLNGYTGLNAAVNDFAASKDVYASAIDLPKEMGGTVTAEEARRQANAELNTFFLGAGGSLRGHIERTYHVEDVFGLGASYVLESDNDFLNQLIFNLEGQYTPKRAFTNTGLQHNLIEQSQYTVSLVIDKWHRIFESFPGTYMVFQALTKNRSDLVGRSLAGFGNSENQVTTGLKGNASYLVFGFLQPFPNKIWAVEFATLYDVKGGILAQPLLQWNPGKGFTVEAYYNYINGNLGSNPNKNLVSTLNFAQEAAMRLTYQF